MTCIALINSQFHAAWSINLGSDAPKKFRSLAEATCFCAKAIVNRFTGQGVAAKGLTGIVGVAKKSSFIMQMMADVMNIPIKINNAEQTSALGAAMFAATAAGIYEKVEDTMKALGKGFDITYYPDKSKTEIYTKRYSKYQSIGHFMERMNL